MSRSKVLRAFCISVVAGTSLHAQSAGTASRVTSNSGRDVSDGNGAGSDSAIATGSRTLTFTGNDNRFPMGSILAENLSQLLSGRFAGVQVVSSGATGTGSRIRIRGQSSLSLTNDPLIVIDGVRLSPALTSTNAATPSRVDDINIEDIASIEVLGGPSATTFYGTGGANGVINITTRRGTVGRAHVRVYTEHGVVSDPHDYPDLWTLWGKRNGASTSTVCTLALVSARTCTADSLSHGNVLNIDSLTPIGVGYRSQYGFQLSGGLQRLQYFVSGEREDETGVFKMPARDVALLKAERGVSSLPSNQLRPSALVRNSARVNISVQPASFVSASLSSAYVAGDVRLVTTDEQSTGLGYNATGGVWRFDRNDGSGRSLAGYAFYPAGDILSQTNTQNVDHYFNTLSLNITPVHWLEARVQGAFDNAVQLDRTLIKRDQGPAGGTREGFISQSRNALSQTTVDVGATAAFKLSVWLDTRTSVGWQRTRTSDNGISGTGFGLPAGATTLGDASVFSGSTSLAETRFSALYLQQVFSFGAKVTVDGGVRRDVPVFASSHGEPTYFPTVGASWVVLGHEAGGADRFNTLRIHSRYGISSHTPNPNEGFAGLYTTIFDSTSYKFKPESVAEAEGGADVIAFGGRSRAGIIAYNSTTGDALVAVDLGPSLGGARSINQGAARIRNEGVELTISQQLSDHRQFAATVLLTGSANRNRLTALPSAAPSYVAGSRSTQRNKVGYPLFGLWSQTYTYTDANQDGIITANELVVSDTAEFIASSFPTRAVALSPTIEFLNHRLRFTGQIDSKWGFKKFNNTLRHQCGSVTSCRGLNDRSAPLATQAAAVAVTRDIFGGMLEDGSFTRFREASVVYELPLRWANALRATSWNVVLTGRNIGIRTNYSGADPESAAGTDDVRSDEFFSTPPMTTYTLRFNIRF